MKRILIVCGVLFYSVFGFAQNNYGKYSYDDLEPSETQHKVEQFVTQFLNNYHYQKFNVDDELSTKVFNNMIESIDGGHSYFTQSDIEEFEKYRFLIDDALLSGDLEIPFEIFNKYRRVYKKRFDYVMNFLDKPFDFTSNEMYSVDEEEKDWAYSEEDLDKEWDKIITSQALSLKLSGSSDSAIVSTLKRRFDRYESRVAKWHSEDIFQTYMNSFTRAIDPHTSYMIPRTAAQFNIDMSQSLEGIGARLQNNDDYVMIMDIIPGGPLFKTQLANNDDYILGVAQGDDGEFQDIVGWLTDDAVNLIRGKKGTVVRLLLKAKEAPINSEPREIRIVRDKIKLEEAVASAEVLELKDGDSVYKIGLIDIPMFYRDFDGARSGDDFQSTTKDVDVFLKDFNSKGLDGVIIDLRNNGGGSLTEAINLTGLFIPNGPVVQRRTGKGRIDVEKDNDTSVSYSGPLLVLQNRHSASASEIFAGAIQDYNRGLIVGEQSFGKGTVQQLVNLDQFLLSPRVASRKGAASKGIEEEERYGQLKLTTEKFYRITGNSTQNKGVVPDIALPTPWDSEESGESSMESALPYDQISSSTFTKENTITIEVLSKITNQYNERLSTDEEMKLLVKDIELYKKQREIKEYSLNYEVRLKEKNDNEEVISAIKKLRKTKEGDDRANDVYLVEAQKILKDLIAYQEQ
ncbi:carboxy terminal-processing peptidase [Arcticibacterium luteifluviistationis]|uniref:Tail-specific protease n=1 Tax=Arcticibacterium luteifluviistationis TaxID=1784714 RepID=A0A2Z4GAF5_9BACT|nr:carboxy terminal-processing peptidase [Arcticibacterium luteifluviistationis]AWV98111.1 tail-specific protease [Arcticibacterium luteifluviistationis]